MVLLSPRSNFLQAQETVKVISLKSLIGRCSIQFTNGQEKQMASLICFMMQLAQTQLSQPPVWLQTPSALYFSTLRGS